MAKKMEKRQLISEVEVKRLKRLAGMIDDNTDVEDDDLLMESSEVPGRPNTQTPRGAGPAVSGQENPVLNEEEEEEVESVDGGSESGLEDDSEVGEFGDFDNDQEAGDHPEPDADNAGGLGASGASDKMAIANKMKELGELLGFEFEIQGSGSAGMPEMGDEMGTDLPEEGDSMGSGMPEDVGSSEAGSPVPGMGEDDDLTMEQQKMLAEIFAKTSKQIMDSIKKSQSKKPVAKQASKKKNK